MEFGETTTSTNVAFMVVSVQALSFSYEGAASAALTDVSFEVAPGQIVGLVGASGSGKSTLLKIIAGILPNDPGQKATGKVEVLSRSPRAAAASGDVGFVFQDFKLLPFLTVSENLLWGLKRASAGRLARISSLNEEVGRLLDLVGLSEFRTYFPKQLSGGMRARVAIARAIAGGPDLLLIDEAFSPLDVGWRISLYRELKRLRDTLHLSIVLISHDLEEVVEISDSILVLSPKGVPAGSISPGSIKGASAELRRLVLLDHPAGVVRP